MKKKSARNRRRPEVYVAVRTYRGRFQVLQDALDRPFMMSEAMWRESRLLPRGAFLMTPTAADALFPNCHN